MTSSDPDLAAELLQHQGFLKRLAQSLVGQEAEDLVQDVWERALARPPARTGELRAWLARVARNLAANRHRAQARRQEREARVAHAALGAGGVDEQLERRFELQRELAAALDALPEPYRGALLLRYFEGLDHAEIARRQGVPLATVRTRLRRGLERLRSALDRRHGGERQAWFGGLALLAGHSGDGAAVAAGSSTIFLGGLAMGTIGKLALGAAVICAGVVLATRAPRGAPATGGPALELEAPAAPGDVAAETPRKLLGPEATPPRRAVAASDPVSAGPAQPEGRWLLRGRVLGLSEREAAERA